MPQKFLFCVFGAKLLKSSDFKGPKKAPRKFLGATQPFKSAILVLKHHNWLHCFSHYMGLVPKEFWLCSQRSREWFPTPRFFLPKSSLTKTPIIIPIECEKSFSSIRPWETIPFLRVRCTWLKPRSSEWLSTKLVEYESLPVSNGRVE